MIGAGQSVLRGKMQDYEFLRLEPRPDGVVLHRSSVRRSQRSRRSASRQTVNDEQGHDLHVREHGRRDFRSGIIYRRGTEGWLYETVEGKLDGSDRKAIYPMRRIDCETGELIHQ